MLDYLLKKIILIVAMVWMSSARPLPKPTANIMPDVHFVFQIILADQNIKQKTKKLFLKQNISMYTQKWRR